MATDTLPPSLSFLTDASHLLATTAPGISAHLMTQRNSLLFQHELPQSDAQKEHVCGCCGHIMIPGQGSLLKLETSKDSLRKKREKKRNEKQPTKKKKIEKAAGDAAQRKPTRNTRKRIECGKCGRVTSITIPQAPPIPRPISRRQQKPPATLPASRDPETPKRKPEVVPSVRLGGATGRDRIADASVEPSKPASANASSKKRAKSRRQGLQALLQQSQSAGTSAQGSGGLGLSLSDFLKK